MHKNKKKFLQNAVNPEKAGMFHDVSIEHIKKELKHLKRTGPHHKGSKEFTRAHELLFALRAKQGHGFRK